MKFARWTTCFVALLAVGLILPTVGCTRNDKKGNEPQAKGKDDHKGDDKDHKDDKHAKDKKGHDHSGWWCAEHGVPEHLCSLCQEDVAAKLKKAGDWCKIHDRAQSQCFLCDPSKYAKFEAMYEAKYGRKPERPPESEFKEKK